MMRFQMRSSRWVSRAGRRKRPALSTSLGATVLLISSLAIATEVLAADNWSSFQNGGAASVEDARSLPLNWSPDSGIAWQATLQGYGQSSPVVQAGHVYVTTVTGDMKEQLHVQAFALSGGESLWTYDLANSTPEKNSTYVSRAAPSPVTDADGIIAGFEGGNVVALTHAGKLRWQRDLVADYGPITARHGLASSLEQDQKHAFVWIQRSEDSYVVALSKKTGETIWKAPALEGTSWSSPRLVSVGDSHHLVLSGIGHLAGLDPADGKRLWDFDDIENNSTPTPVPISPGRFLIGATDGRGESAGGNAAESNGVIEISAQADGSFQAAYVWRAKKATSSFGSPIVHQGLAYFVNRAGAVYCVDAETGTQHYSKRSASSLWATPIAVADRVYLFGKDGTTTVLRAGEAYEQLAENQLWKSEAEKSEGQPGGGPSFGGPVLYAAAATNERLLLRRGDVLYCVQESKLPQDENE